MKGPPSISGDVGQTARLGVRLAGRCECSAERDAGETEDDVSMVAVPLSMLLASLSSHSNTSRMAIVQQVGSARRKALNARRSPDLDRPHRSVGGTRETCRYASGEPSGPSDYRAPVLRLAFAVEDQPAGAVEGRASRMPADSASAESRSALVRSRSASACSRLEKSTWAVYRRA